MTDVTRAEMLAVLGAGGTTELADRLIAFIRDRDAAPRVITGNCPDRTVILGLAEVCALIGRPTNTVWNWVDRNKSGKGGMDFPVPLWTLKSGSFWEESQIVDWARNHPDRVGWDTAELDPFESSAV